MDVNQVAIEFITSGGTREAWIQAYDAAAESMRGEDHRASVRKDHARPVSAPHPIPAADLQGPIQKDLSSPVSGGEASSGEGHSRSTEDLDPYEHKRTIIPLRDRITGKLAGSRHVQPSAEDIAARVSTAQLTFFEITKLRGKFLGAYKFGELNSAKQMNRYENGIIDRLLEYARERGVGDGVLVKEGISESDLKVLIEPVRKQFSLTLQVANG